MDLIKRVVGDGSIFEDCREWNDEKILDFASGVNGALLLKDVVDDVWFWIIIPRCAFEDFLSARNWSKAKVITKGVDARNEGSINVSGDGEGVFLFVDVILMCSNGTDVGL